MRCLAFTLGCALAATTAIAQDNPELIRPNPEEAPASGWRQAGGAEPGAVTVEPGTRVPLALINTINTKETIEGDRVYLKTVFPVVIDGRVVIPPDTYVNGTVTHVKRPGRVKGRGELHIRFDSMILRSGITRDFRGRVSALDGGGGGTLKREEGKIESEGDKAGDARRVGEVAITGASIGALTGAVSGGRAGMGAGVGAAAGAAAGLVGVLATRGPEAILTRGSTIEMVLDRPLYFTEEELDRANIMPASQIESGPSPAQREDKSPLPRRRTPLSPF